MTTMPKPGYSGWKRLGGFCLALITATLILGPAVPLGGAGVPGQAGAVQASASLNAILEALLHYDYAQGVGEPLRLRAYIAAHKGVPAERAECEAKLIAFLKKSPTAGGLMAACRALREIGTNDSVPALTELLTRPETTDPARFALEGIPGDQAASTLIAALDQTSGAVRRGVISSLGSRRAPGAAPRLSVLAAGNDAATALEAVMALGKIGSAESVRFLTSFLGKARGPLQSAAASALLLCAELRLKVGLADEAAAIYDRVSTAGGLSDPIRQAAFRGRVTAAGPDDDGGFVLKALSGRDAVLITPAIAMIPKAFVGQEVAAVLPFLDTLSEDAQVQLVAVLAGYPSEVVMPALRRQADSPSVRVRIAALRALEVCGDASVVEFLAERAASSAGQEQVAAREALARMRGSSIDAAVLNLLEKTQDEKIMAELIAAAGERRITAGKPLLTAIVRSGPPAARTRAIRALRVLSTPGDLRDLAGLVFAVPDEAAREEMEDTVAAVARTIPRETVRAEAVENLLSAETIPARKADLVRVLGKIGDDTSLPLVRRALADSDQAVVDAAVRALAEWPTISARDDVLALAGSSDNMTYKVLALRAYVRMVSLEPYLRPEGAVANLAKALALADRPEEKKLVLGMLPRFPCKAGLELATSLAADPALASEARLAAERIRASLARR